MNCDLSIIVPIYNSEDYLEDFFKSLIKQNINYEVILINDASTDNSLKIIQKYCNKYSNWKYINNETNKGPNKSRNIGLKEALGNYIIFCDSDDLIPNNIFKKMLFKIKKEQGDIILGQVRKFSNIPPIFSKYDFIENIYVWEDDINKFIFKNIHEDLITNISENPEIICDLSIWNKIYKKELLINHFFNENKGYDGMEGGMFCIPLLFKAKKIIILNEVVYYWRHHQNSLSVKEGLSKDKLNYIFKELDLINNYNEICGDEYFNMIVNVILPGFLGFNNNYY